GEENGDDLALLDSLARLRRCLGVVERRILLKDRGLETAQRLARLEPELVDEERTPGAVRLERVRLPSGAVEREHELAAQPLAQRIALDQRLELRDEPGVHPERELRLDARLERRQAELCEPCCFGARKRLVDVRERGTAPECERLSECLG